MLILNKFSLQAKGGFFAGPFGTAGNREVGFKRAREMACTWL